MRIYQIDDFGMDALHTEERDIPRPGEREILVKVRAVSLNFRDLMVVSGTYNPRMKLPAVPFSDCAGEIVGLGEQVTRWTLGDRVCSTVIPGWIHGGPTAEKSKTAIGAGKGGVLAEFVTFDEDAIVRMPGTLDLKRPRRSRVLPLRRGRPLWSQAALDPVKRFSPLARAGFRSLPSSSPD